MKFAAAIFLLLTLSIKSPSTSTIDRCKQMDDKGKMQSVKFVAIGDYGKHGEPEKQVSELINQLAPEFIITLGDNNYEFGAADTIDKNIGQYYSEYIFPYQGEYPSSATENRFFPSLGNHDWRIDQGQPYIDYFSLPNNERYYQFSWGQTDFFALNSNDAEPDGVGVNSIQAQWLKESLANSTAEWKIVFFHHPPYSSAEHGSFKPMQWPFKEWGASLVLSGHDHIYERLEVDGLTYIVAGLAGKNKYAFKNYLSESIVRYRENFGVPLISVCGSTLKIEFITIDNQVIDRFLIYHPIRNRLSEMYRIGLK